jgi:hypothetical protein
MRLGVTRRTEDSDREEIHCCSKEAKIRTLERLNVLTEEDIDTTDFKYSDHELTDMLWEEGIRSPEEVW